MSVQTLREHLTARTRWLDSELHPNSVLMQRDHSWTGEKVLKWLQCVLNWDQGGRKSDYHGISPPSSPPSKVHITPAHKWRATVSFQLLMLLQETDARVRGLHKYASSLGQRLLSPLSWQLHRLSLETYKVLFRIPHDPYTAAPATLNGDSGAATKMEKNVFNLCADLYGQFKSNKYWKTGRK